MAKEEKKRRKEEARTKLAQEVGSSQAPTVSRAPIPDPTLPHPHDLDTQMDTSSSDSDKEQGQAEVQVPHLGVAQSQEPSAEQVSVTAQDKPLDTTSEQVKDHVIEQQIGGEVLISTDTVEEQGHEQTQSLRADPVDIPHRPGKEPYKEPAKVKVISLGATPIRFNQPIKPVPKEIWSPLNMDLTASPQPSELSMDKIQDPKHEEQKQPGKERVKDTTERIDLTHSPPKDTTSDESEEEIPDKEERCVAWKKHMMSIKHSAAHQVHHHTVATAPQVGAQFTELLEQASAQCLPSFLKPDTMENALTMTILSSGMPQTRWLKMLTLSVRCGL